MAKTIHAVYENGILRPLEKLERSAACSVRCGAWRPGPRLAAP